jgi:hypothetical protein
MPALSTTYTPSSVTTSTPGGGGGGGDLMDEYLRRRMFPPPKQGPDVAKPQTAGRMASRAAPQARVTGGDGRGGTRIAADPLADMKAMDRYDQSLRVGARKPIAGFNYQGWDAGVENLPTRLRPQAAGVHVSPEEQFSAQRKAQDDSVWADLMESSRQATRLPVRR